MRGRFVILSLSLVLAACADDAGGVGNDGTGDGSSTGTTPTTNTTMTTSTTTTDPSAGTVDDTGDTSSTGPVVPDGTSTDGTVTGTTDTTDTMPTDSSSTTDEPGESSSSESSSSESSSSESSSSEGSSSESSSSDGGMPDCMVNADCDNGLYCDGTETCVAGSCVAGTPIACAPDTVDCTVAACNEATDSCVQQPMNGLCPAGQTCNPVTGCQAQVCVPAACVNQTYQCGNCIDDDGDGAIDMADANCWGPCDNNESGWNGNIPGQQSQSTCNTMDCYFDGNSGSGNDECHWSHTCDPLEPNGCTFNPNTNIPGAGGQATCAGLFQNQSQTCHTVCEPITPNGCDCFGCCQVFIDEDTSTTVYLGSQNAQGQYTCSLENADDPALCHPCTQVVGCGDIVCGECELCLGQTELPPECTPPEQCPGGEQACGLAGQDPCPQNFFCLTGCCQPIPM